MSQNLKNIIQIAVFIAIFGGIFLLYQNGSLSKLFQGKNTKTQTEKLATSTEQVQEITMGSSTITQTRESVAITKPTEQTQKKSIDPKKTPQETSLNETRDLGVASESPSSKVSFEVVSYSDSDTEAVRLVLDKVKNAFFTANFAVLNDEVTLSSKKILDSYINQQSLETERAGVFTVKNVFHANEKIITFVELAYSGKTENEVYTFVKENDEWKWDLTASTNSYNPNPDDYVDFKVTGITFTPTNPTILDKELKITASIKNIGTKVVKGASVFAWVTSSDGKRSLFQAVADQLPILAPGDVAEWTFGPKSMSGSFSLLDSVGDKKIEVEINNDRDIKESDYSNNLLEQTLVIK